MANETSDHPCHRLPRDQWCDSDGAGGFMGHTCSMPTTLTRDELLILLVEECGEVIQAATKCLRFGWDRNQPNYGVNHEVLAKEIGDLHGVIEALPLDVSIIHLFRDIKIRKAERVKREIANVG